MPTVVSDRGLGVAGFFRSAFNILAVFGSSKLPSSYDTADLSVTTFHVIRDDKIEIAAAQATAQAAQAREDILGFLTYQQYDSVLERIIDIQHNTTLYRTSLSSVLLTSTERNSEVCKRFADGLETSARAVGTEALEVLHEVFDIGAEYNYIHLYLDIWRVYLNNSTAETRGEYEATIRGYAEDPRHVEDAGEILQMLEDFTDATPIEDMEA